MRWLLQFFAGIRAMVLRTFNSRRPPSRFRGLVVEGLEVRACPAVNFTSFPPADPSSGIPTVQEGSPFFAGVEFDTSAFAGSANLAIHWGNGSQSTLVSGSSSVLFDAWAYGDNGTHNVVVTLSDGGASESDSRTLVVNNAVPSLMAAVSHASPSLGETVSITGTTRDAGRDDSLTLSIDWGDGSSTPLPPVPAGASPQPIAGLSHAYTTTGTFAVKATLTDDDAASMTLDWLVAVSGTSSGTSTTTTTNSCTDPPSLALSLNAPTQAATEGTVWTGLTGNLNAGLCAGTSAMLAIDWGDGDSTSFPVYSGASQLYGVPHVYFDDKSPTPTEPNPVDTYAISATLSFGTLAVAANTVVTVNNANPWISVSTPMGGTEGQALSLSGTLGDPGVVDKVTLQIDWGDSSTPPGSLERTISSPGQTESWSLTHIYADDGSYTATLTATDEDGGTATTTMQVWVQNALPDFEPGALTFTSATVNEGGVATLVGTIVDPGLLDGHEVAIQWGDNESETFSLAAGVLNFSRTHTYVDDGWTSNGQWGNGTPSDTYWASVWITDKDGGSGAGSASLTVENVAPTIVTLTPTGAFENGTPSVSFDSGTATLSGTFTDAGIADQHSLWIDWGDGQSTPVSQSDIVVVAPGTANFSATHVYRDDDEYPVAAGPRNGTASDDYPIRVTLIDDDGATATSATSLTVSNSPPQIDSIAFGGPIGRDGTAANPFIEGDQVSVTVTISDRGSDDHHTLVIDWGDGSEPTTLHQGPCMNVFVSPPHTYADDNTTPNDVYDIRFKLSDDDNSVLSTTRSIILKYAEPNAQLMPPVQAQFGIPVVTDLTIEDVGVADNIVVVVDWNDGHVDSIDLPADGQITRTFTLSHEYYRQLTDDPADTQYKVIAISVVDDDSGSFAISFNLTLLPAFVFAADVESVYLETTYPDTPTFKSDEWIPDHRMTVNSAAGIRRNGDDDDGNGSPDLSDTSNTVPGENDLLAIGGRLSRSLQSLAVDGVQVVVKRSGPQLELWRTNQKGTKYFGNSNEFVLTPNINNQKRFVYYVEWTTMDKALDVGTITIVYRRTVNGQLVDTPMASLDFRPFKSVVVGFIGENQNVTQDKGIRQIVTSLRRVGYDVFIFDEDDVGNDLDFVAETVSSTIGITYNGVGPYASFDEIYHAVTERGVTEVAMIGYSHGGGAVYELSDVLKQAWPNNPPFSIVATACIDAVRKGTASPETRGPIDTKKHYNAYQKWLAFLDAESTAINGAALQSNQPADLTEVDVDAGKNLLNELHHTNFSKRGIAENFDVQSSVLFLVRGSARRW